MNKVELFNMRLNRIDSANMLSDLGIKSAGKSGVYHLVDGCEVVYVGQTSNLKCRIASHMRDKKFSSVNFFECKDNLNNEEAADIVKYKPVLNRTLPNCSMFMTTQKLKRDLSDRVSSIVDSMIRDGSIDVLYSSDSGIKYVSVNEVDAIFELVKTSM